MVDVLYSMGIDISVLISILLILILILTVIVVVVLIRMEKIYKRYDFFMRGKDAETLEDKIVEIYARMREFQDQDLENRDIMKVINKNVVSSLQKTGLVKYNAFDGMGGQSSFALAVLDQTNSGFLINAMHSRTSCYVYIKEIKEGEPDSPLGKEEKDALEIALKSK